MAAAGALAGLAACSGGAPEATPPTAATSTTGPGATASPSGTSSSAAASSSGSRSGTPSAGGSATTARPSADGGTAASPGTGSASTDATPSPPPSKPANGSQQAVLSAIPGNASGCVVVGTRADVRSGGIAAGNFAGARREYAGQAGGAGARTVSLYVIPKHAKKMPGLSVRMAPVSGDGSARTVRTSAAETANSWSYYPLTLPVPASGVWRLSMTAGPDTGCFEVSFGG